MATLIECLHRDDAAALLARRIGERLRHAVYRSAAASMIVSGGEGSRPLFRALRLLPVPWYGVTIVPSDERWVPVDDEDSNEGMLRRECLAGEPGFAHFLSLYRRNQAPSDCLPALRASLAEVPRPFDSVVLDVGADGHLVSLLPGSPDLEHALFSDAECFVHAGPRSVRACVSLTLRLLLDAREINLLIFGAGKRAAYEEALRPGPLEQLPVRALLHQERVPVNVYSAP